MKAILSVILLMLEPAVALGQVAPPPPSARRRWALSGLSPQADDSR